MIGANGNSIWYKGFNSCLDQVLCASPRRNTIQYNGVYYDPPQEVMAMFKDLRRYHELVDPLIKSKYPAKALNQVGAMAAMCLQEEDDNDEEDTED
ncbi:hypothetical protein GUJ93_ZPchr0001g30130 [Zizania palustris]|uniref:Uncharacterized protein n=1 Tax=Zizania palustris TaxID=103762 RepID=A0A8J5VQ79_ZIZPA|nr:hypothetical protein GUJ93_ZPchr0001g30130 [Zizania palustris]